MLHARIVDPSRERPIGIKRQNRVIARARPEGTSTAQAPLRAHGLTAISRRPSADQARGTRPAFLCVTRVGLVRDWVASQTSCCWLGPALNASPPAPQSGKSPSAARPV